MKIKNYDIVILLSTLLIFSVGIGFLYSAKNNNQTPKSKTIKTQVETGLVSTIPEPPKAPPAPYATKQEEAPSKIEHVFTLEEIFDYIIDWAKAASDDSIIEFLEEECPKDKIVEVIQKIVDEHISDLSRKGVLNIIFSLAKHFKDDKNIQDQLFNVLIKNDSLALKKPPILVVAVQTKHKDLIPDLLNFAKRNLEKVKTKEMDKKALLYAAKNDIPEYLESLHENIEKITADMASELLFELVKANKSGKSIPFLVKIGADINYHDDKTNLTILMHAIKNQNLDLIKKIVEAGADVKKPSKDKKIGYPLQLARELGNLEIEMYLREKGARD